MEEYLAADRLSEYPSEYVDGEVFPLAANSVAHGLLAVSLGRRLAERLDGGPCAVASQVRLKVSATRYVYPDLLVYCGAAATTDAHGDTITNPKVVFEILSPSTAGYDRGLKFDFYRDVPSIEEYVLISQELRRVETMRRTPEGDWLLKRYEGPESVLSLGSLGVAIPLAEIYTGIL